MTHHTLLIYSTVDGHTRHICERMKFVMTALGQNVTLVPRRRLRGVKKAMEQPYVLGGKTCESTNGTQAGFRCCG